MNKATLTQATLLALTMQNQAQKVAPLSTATMQGICINRNISIGETVCCYLNQGGSLTRVGDSPTFGNNYFLDDNSRLYTVANNKLKITDGLSGVVLSESIDAYRLVCYNGGQCAAFKTSEDDNTWRVILPDGTMNAEITFEDFRDPWFGYRNGIIAATIYYDTNGSVWTYTPMGTLLSTLSRLPIIPSNAVGFISPLNENAVAAGVVGHSGLFEPDALHCFILNPYSATEYTPWEEYDVTNLSPGSKWIGIDQSNAYGVFQAVHEEEGEEPIYLDEWYVVKWSLDTGANADILDHYYDERTYGVIDTYGNLVRQREVNEVVVRDMLDVTTFYPVYSDVLSTSLLPSSGYIMENEGWIWLSGIGVFQKTPLDWLMYPTSEYPRSSPWGKLGYAIRNVKIGQNGLAIVLFE